MRPLRVLVVPPFYGGSLPVARSVERCLKTLGHVVGWFDSPAFFGGYEALKAQGLARERLEQLENAYLQTVSQAVLAKVERFAPDLVLALAQAPLSRQALKRLKSLGVPSVMWFVEDFRVFPYWRAYAPLYDAFAVIQKEPFFSELAAVGQTNVLYLPLAADPAVHRPLELSPAERARFGAEVGFMGAGYPNRRVAFRSLADRDLAIWGTEWEDEPLLAPKLKAPGKRLTVDEYVAVFNATKINLNLHSSVHADPVVSGGDFVNPRTFELAACGAFQLVDARTLLPELFAPDELAVFSDLAELRSLIELWLARPEERRNTAERARKRVLAEHSYAHRLAVLLDFCQGRLAIPEKPRQAPPEEIPASIREEYFALAAELSLAPDAAFEDVVAAVREKSGRLNPLESTILFLDEWKKQVHSLAKRREGANSQPQG